MESAKREAILEAAGRAFARHGFKKASVDEIARDAGVAKGTIYLACASKEDLFYQAVHRELRAWIAEIAKHIDPRVPADELLGRAAMAAYEYLGTHTLVKDLFSGIFHGQLPGWGGRFNELREMGTANIREILELGIRQGVFRENLDVDETARLLQDLNLISYLREARTGPPSAEELQRRFRAGLELVLLGIKPRKD